MNKGQAIKKYIAEGLNNEQILALVDTTGNSINWYRSKLRATTSITPVERPRTNVTQFTPRKPTTDRTPRTVGEAADKWGFAEEIVEAVKRLVKDNPERHIDTLRGWNFVVNGRANGRWGVCKYRTKTIEVHPVLLDHPADLRQTFLHECAHMLDVAINGRSSRHGYAWQHIMSVGFKLDPRRCSGHSEAAEKAFSAHVIVTKKVAAVWVCDRCGHEHGVSSRMKYAPERYTHQKCGGHFKHKA